MITVESLYCSPRIVEGYAVGLLKGLNRHNSTVHCCGSSKAALVMYI